MPASADGILTADSGRGVNFSGNGTGGIDVITKGAVGLHGSAEGEGDGFDGPLRSC